MKHPSPDRQAPAAHPHLRIGVNAVPLRVTSGGGRYMFLDLMRQFLTLDQSHRYVLFAHSDDSSQLADLCAAHDKSGDRVTLIQAANEEQIFPHRDKFDLYFSPLNSLRPRLLDRPFVAMLQDIQEQYFPEYFSFAELIARREYYPEICRAATTVVTVSEFCKNCFIEKFAVDAGKIQVVHLAPQASIAQGSGEVWRGPALPERFYFYPANCYPHKNHALLLDAIERLAAENHSTAAAVFSGVEPLGGFPLRKEIARRKMGGRCLFFTGLPADQMRYLYQHATATVMPTMFEGFGMPVVEAFACGCPVVCSDIPPLREVAGDSALYFEPGSLDDLCDRLRQISQQADLREQLISGGRALSEKFTWEIAGRKMLDIFDRAVARFSPAQAPGAIAPKIGVFVRVKSGGAALMETLAGIAATGYQNMVVAICAKEPLPKALDLLREQNIPVVNASAGDTMLGFAERENLDLVGEILEGNRLRLSAADSLAGALAAQHPSAVYFGEVAIFRRGRYRSVSRLRLTGDDMWKLDGLLYPEMLWLAPRAFSRWHGGRAIVEGGLDGWRWRLVWEARMDDELTIVRRTLADTERSSLSRLAGWRALRAGALDFHHLDNRPVHVPLLRRFEQKARLLSQYLPLPLAHMGTRLWYRLTR